LRRTLLTRRAGQPGTKKLMAQYGEDLVCVRYRYDADTRERIKTVEVIVERTAWRSRAPSGPESVVRIRVEPDEDLLRRALLQSGGRWDEPTDTWKLTRKTARALGLLPRILRGRPQRRELLSGECDPGDWCS